MPFFVLWCLFLGAMEGTDGSNLEPESAFANTFTNPDYPESFGSRPSQQSDQPASLNPPVVEETIHKHIGTIVTSKFMGVVLPKSLAEYLEVVWSRDTSLSAYWDKDCGFVGNRLNGLETSISNAQAKIFAVVRKLNEYGNAPFQLDPGVSP